MKITYLKFFLKIFIFGNFLFFIGCGDSSSNSVSPNSTSSILQPNSSAINSLPVIYINTEANVSIQRDDYTQGTIQVYGQGIVDSMSEVTMKIRGRGHSTWGIHPKKPYQMKLSDSSAFLDMPKKKRWLFMAEYSDKTMLRNRLAMELGYLSNLDWTPNSHYADVYINKVSMGTYRISEKVEEGSNRVDIGDNGFLLEIDYNGHGHVDANDVYFETNQISIQNGNGRGNVIQIKEPDLAQGDQQYNFIKDYIIDFETALFSANFTDPVNGYLPYVDINSFADWFLINEIAKNQDARAYSSIYLHYIPGQKIKMGPIWDFDLGFGNVDYSDATYAQGWWVYYHWWIERLMQDPAFVNKVKERFTHFKSNEQYLLLKIDEWSQMLRKSVARNDDIWGTLGVYIWPNSMVYATYNGEVEHLKNWLRERFIWMESAIEQL
jgi:hypothetical protein